MNLRDLEYIVAVADTEHFGQAALACHVSQPALSMQIKKLETELGVPLFERSNKKVMTTDAGREIIVRAKMVLQETEAITEIAQYYKDPLSGKIIFGAFPTLGPYILPQIIPILHRHFPNISFYLKEDKTENLISMLKDGDIEVALIALPVEEDQLDYKIIFQEDFLLAVHKDNPLSKKTSITVDDIQRESLLLLEEGHCLRNQALDVCMSMGALENTEFRATSLETLRQMVAANVGITLIPQFAVRETEDICYIPFDAPVPSRTIALFWRKSSPRQDLINQISQEILLQFSQK